ncbi:sugar-binding protein, partial [Bacteroidota bacterium]
KDAEFVIDGSIDTAWKNHPEMKGEYSLTDVDPPSESDLSYSFRLSANDSALFLFTYIKDDILTMEDNLELFLNPDNNHLPLGVYGEDAIHIRLNYGLKDTLSIGNGTWKANDYKGFKCITADTTGGYILEARIPWRGIFSFEVDSAMGRYMGFEVQVNDYDIDPEIKNKLAWANNTGIDFSLYDTRKFGTLAITREPDPPARVTGVEISQDTIIIQSGQTVILEADVLPENAENKTVTWNALDATVVNLAPSTGVAQGLYYGTTLVIATTQDGGFTDTCLVIVPDPTSTHDLEDLEWTAPGNREISLIPNPANRSFRIKGINLWAQMQVYSITGELMLNLSHPGNEDYINIEQLPAGLYLVRIHAQNKIFQKKIIKN